MDSKQMRIRVNLQTHLLVDESSRKPRPQGQEEVNQCSWMKNPLLCFESPALATAREGTLKVYTTTHATVHT